MGAANSRISPRGRQIEIRKRAARSGIRDFSLMRRVTKEIPGRFLKTSRIQEARGAILAFRHFRIPEFQESLGVIAELGNSVQEPHAHLDFQEFRPSRASRSFQEFLDLLAKIIVTCKSSIIKGLLQRFNTRPVKDKYSIGAVLHKPSRN